MARAAPLVVRLRDIDDSLAPITGPEARSLARLAGAGLRVPPGFSVLE